MNTPCDSPRKIVPSKDSLSTVDLNTEESKIITEKESTIRDLSNAMQAAKNKGIHYPFFSWQAKKKILGRNHADFLDNPCVDSLVEFILTAKKQRAPKLNTNDCTKSIKNLLAYLKELPDLAKFILELPDELNEEEIFFLKKELYAYFPELNATILNWRFK